MQSVHPKTNASGGLVIKIGVPKVEYYDMDQLGGRWSWQSQFAVCSGRGLVFVRGYPPLSRFWRVLRFRVLGVFVVRRNDADCMGAPPTQRQDRAGACNYHAG
jgi:hypothetical protein